jgi:site-specific recombinase XerD
VIQKNEETDSQTQRKKNEIRGNPCQQLGREFAAWRDALLQRGMSNSSVCRKMTVFRSFFSYLQTYGYTGINPAHSDFVKAPSVPRDGKTVGLSPDECRRLLDAPSKDHRKGIRDRAIMSILAYSACRVGELVRLRVGDYKITSGHKVLEIRGKGGKERRVPLHPEAFERLDAWLAAADSRPFFPNALSRYLGVNRDGPSFDLRVATTSTPGRCVAEVFRVGGFDGPFSCLEYYPPGCCRCYLAARSPGYRWPNHNSS